MVSDEEFKHIKLYLQIEIKSTCPASCPKKKQRLCVVVKRWRDRTEYGESQYGAEK